MVLILPFVAAFVSVVVRLYTRDINDTGSISRIAFYNISLLLYLK